MLVRVVWSGEEELGGGNVELWKGCKVVTVEGVSSILKFDDFGHVSKVSSLRVSVVVR